MIEFVDMNKILSRTKIEKGEQSEETDEKYEVGGKDGRDVGSDVVIREYDEKDNETSKIFKT